MKLTITKDVIIKESDIDDIMCTALEGGITYWCIDAKPTAENWPEKYGVKWLHEIISRGGEIILTDEDDVKYRLTKHHFLTGLQQFVNEFNCTLEPCNGGYNIDTSEIDASGADLIIQYALFGELVFA